MKLIGGVKGWFRGKGEVELRISQGCKLMASSTEHYLPCENCGYVYAVELNVVSFECPRCVEKFKLRDMGLDDD